MGRLCCADEGIIGYIQGFPQVFVPDHHLVGKLYRLQSLLLGRFFHFLPVLVRSCQEEDIFSGEFLETAYSVGDDCSVGVPDMRDIVDVIDGGSDVKRFLRLLYHRTYLL